MNDTGKTDVQPGMSQDNESFRCSTVQDPKKTDIVNVDSLIDRMQFDAADTKGNKSLQFFAKMRIVRMNAAKTHQLYIL